MKQLLVARKQWRPATPQQSRDITNALQILQVKKSRILLLRKHFFTIHYLLKQFNTQTDLTKIYTV